MRMQKYSKKSEVLTVLAWLLLVLHNYFIHCFDCASIVRRNCASMACASLEGARGVLAATWPRRLSRGERVLGAKEPGAAKVGRRKEKRAKKEKKEKKENMGAKRGSEGDVAGRQQRGGGAPPNLPTTAPEGRWVHVA